VKKKILFTGGSGLLATNWALSIINEFDIVLGLHQKQILLDGIQTLLVETETVSGFLSTLEELKPDIVIHCTALTNVEVCESDPELAWHVNVELAMNVAVACKQFGIQMVHVSTDHLFSGNTSLVSETEPPTPVNQYGKTKWEGEKAVLDVSENFLAIRTNFYGWGPSYRRSFSDMIIDNLRNGKRIQLFEDFYYTPILVEELAQTVMLLCQAKARGVFNVVGNERISKLDFGIRLAAQFGLNKNLIETSRFSERKDLVKRPQDLSLSNKKAELFLNRTIGDVNAGIEKLYRQAQSGIAAVMNKL
jgi:dTDP-4-dehydrorhamnose reductase